MQQDSKQRSLWILSLGALGVVFGDIGTSPLYAFRECFGPHYGLMMNHDNIVGVLSLIFWTLISMICFKYMMIVLKADNKGEGGILSLMALAMRAGNEGSSSRRRWFVIVLGLFGAALLFGDGVITPAISILSAVEGLKVVTPIFEPFVIPVTVTIVVILFLFQFFGTGRIGVVFGPIIVLWFGTIAYFGVNSILENPSVLEAFNPIWAAQFFVNNGMMGFWVLGSVVLVVTGGEALYADMGHFGKRPIRYAWFLLALPCLVLNYFGQGALLLRNPDAISNPFYLMAPKESLWLLVGLATAASVIASQALISGIFSISRQAVQLGYAPRLAIVHTSSREIGQIYIPIIKLQLMAGI